MVKVARIGMYDIVILNINNLREKMPELVNDFPGGAKRFIWKAQGYEVTIWNGKFFSETMNTRECVQEMFWVTR